MQQLCRPTPGLVESYIRRFDQQESLAAAERALRKLFRACPENREIEEVWIKVAAINSLYYTNIFATFDMAKHICELDTDAQINRQSADLVNEIATVTINGKTRRFYSFASKYCSWHAPDAYPIYDSYVERLIWAYAIQQRFDQFERADLQDYPKYRNVIDSFREHYGLELFDFKSLDKFLWSYGKELFGA